MFGKIFKAIMVPLRYVYRAISPNAEGMQALLIRTIVTDVVRSYLSHNPKTEIHVAEIGNIVKSVRTILGINESTAERVIRSVIQEIGVMVKGR